MLSQSTNLVEMRDDFACNTGPASHQLLAAAHPAGVLTLLLLCGFSFWTWPTLDHQRRAASIHTTCTSPSRTCSGSRAATSYLRRFSAARRPAADLLGRRRVLVAGLVWFARLLAGRRPGAQRGPADRRSRAQGVGAAMMAPAGALDPHDDVPRGQDRNTALGVWGAISAARRRRRASSSAACCRGPGLAVGLLRQRPDRARFRWASFRCSRRRAQARRQPRL